jgi:prepilin-type N-terminal cleavage/methylation domain-containing protein/prepilin-type processing-associated H-X9-DG protein
MFMKRGFTLLELLICLLVLATLIAILFPVFFYVKKNAIKINTFSSLRNLGIAWKLYSNDYDDYLMRGNYGGENWFGNGGGGVLRPYLGIGNIRDKSVDWFSINKVSYWPGYGYNPYFSVNDVFNRPSALHISAIGDLSGTVCFAPAAGYFKVNGRDELYNVAMLSTPSFRFPTFHARFSGNSGVLWADGHVSNERAKYLVFNPIYKNLYLGEIDRDSDWRTDESFDLN